MSRSEGTLPREFLFLLMSCVWLCGSLLAYVPDWHPPRKFSEISEKFPPTLCMSFVFYYTSSWVFHLLQRKTHCSGLKCKCMCACVCVGTHIYMHVYTHICAYLCISIHVCMYICVWLSVSMYTYPGAFLQAGRGEVSGRLYLFMMVIRRTHNHFVP